MGSPERIQGARAINPLRVGETQGSQSSGKARIGRLHLTAVRKLRLGAGVRERSRPRLGTATSYELEGGGPPVGRG
jgi:hypothetical protein